ncbi:unnamed protein product [Paramecium primaurelia]|uniref:Uncharacterized protein n=1 Tax=Paramecium primaurelia TaxID=5886 RepID=A0A8S1NFW7_PARPR|nr:unnamed protein product [Paramecium primaurelia]
MKTSKVYKEHLFSHNVSSYMAELIEKNIQSNHVEILLKCQLCSMPVTNPIRHNSIEYIACIFDLDCWIEYYDTNNRDGHGFSCPGCKKFHIYDDYGIDFKLYHALESFQLLQKKYSTIKFDKDKLFQSTQPTNPGFFAQTKVPKNQIQNAIKYQLPGITPIFGIQRKLEENNSLNPTQKNISDEMSYTSVKLQQYTNNKIYKQAKENNQKVEVLQQKIKNIAKDLQKVFKNAMQLVNLTKNKLTNKFIFALKKRLKQGIKESILIVYFVDFGVWHEFSLFLKGRPYLQKEQALYIKGETDNENFIYIIGGKTEDRFIQSNQVIKIKFPNDPFQNGTSAVMEELPNLPEEGYNFMGTHYNNNIYVFYGQRQKKTKDQQIQDELLNKGYVLRKQQNWQVLMQNLIPRFGGSFFVTDHKQFSKLIIIFGGIQHDPDGLVAFRCTQQNRGQIFICKDEKFIGNQRLDFDLLFSVKPEDEYQKQVLSSPVFSAPYYGCNQLILSGEFLKFQYVMKREIYTFDWANGELKKNEIFSLEPPEQFLIPTKKENSFEMFTPVQDMEGAVSFGNFYIIHQYEVEKSNKVVVQLLRINLTNGQFFPINYQDHQSSLQQAILKRNSLPQS